MATCDVMRLSQTSWINRPMNLAKHRESQIEQARIADLMHLIPDGLTSALDVGARDGYLSLKLVDRISNVTSLDLERPDIEHGRVECVKGNITDLEFPAATFDLVFCAEVLEHIPALEKACSELSRVSKKFVVVGVPYKQDIRVGRTTCAECGCKNPPWGHVNKFDERRLICLFPTFNVLRMSFVGTAEQPTNALSCLLMDMAGNPFGTYDQQEPCISCGSSLRRPSNRSLMQKALAKAAILARKFQSQFSKPGPLWIHVLMERAPDKN